MDDWNDALERARTIPIETMEDDHDDDDRVLGSTAAQLTGDESTRTTRTTIALFDSEILRMSRDADQILESIRNEVSSSSQSHRNNSARPTKPVMVSANTSKDFLADDHTWEDDDMADEVERLEAVTEAISRSLNANMSPNTERFVRGMSRNAPATAPLPPLAGASTGTATSDNDEDYVAAFSTSNTTASVPSTSSSSSVYTKQSSFATTTSVTSTASSVCSSNSSTEPAGEALSATTAAAKAAVAAAATAATNAGHTSKSATGSKKRRKKSGAAVPSSLSPTRTPFQTSQHGKSRPLVPSHTNVTVKTASFTDSLWDAMQGFESLLLTVTVVWALILLLLIHARYHLLDANGVVQLPFPSLYQ